MSPEQARGDKVDARSDLFSLGCVLYRLCTGVMPFAGDTTMALLMALALDHPKAVRELNPDMPIALSDLVARLLEKEPAKRPQSAREVVQAIQAISRAPVERAAGLTPPLAKSPRHRPKLRRLYHVSQEMPELRRDFSSRALSSL
jgi:serine/threonine protein kinase